MVDAKGAGVAQSRFKETIAVFVDRATGAGRPRLVSLFLTGLLLVAAAGAPRTASAEPADAAPAVPGLLMGVAFADAMADCAERIHATGEVACDLLPAELQARHSFWIWQSDAGATVSRTRSGDYRLRNRDCLGAFCSWLSCRVAEWPVLQCSDGGKRKAQVPDEHRFILGGTDYVRVREAR